VQHFAGVVPELLECFNSEETTEIVVAFCDAIAASRGAIVVHKILLQGHIINGPLFEESSARGLLVPNICRWIKPHLGKLDEFKLFNPRDSRSAQDVSKITWLECARLSVAVVAALADKLHSFLVDSTIAANPHLLAQEQDSMEFVLSLLPRLAELYNETGLPGTRRLLLQHRSAATVIQKEPTVFPSSHPAPLLVELPPAATTMPSQGTGPTIILRGETAACIVVLMHIAPANVLNNYLHGCLEIEGFSSFSRFLSSLLRTCCSFLAFEAFPSIWLNISMLAHKAIVKIAKPVADIMQQYLIPDKDEAASFDLEIWKNFFDMMLKLLSSPSLVIEDFSPARQRAVWRLAGDIRGEGSKILLGAWEALNWPDKARQEGTDIQAKIGGYQAGLGHMVSCPAKRLASESRSNNTAAGGAGTRIVLIAPR
jgi:dedicator of cytokinesis protein 3